MESNGASLALPLIARRRSERWGEGHGADDARHGRLAKLKVELDRCWDLLRQREAREEFQLDPDDASVRDAGTVEGYEQ
jgi:hypothetical protein